MMAGLLLDGLLLLVVALYVPIGAWRGGLREALLGGAILLGAATAAALAPTWGDTLANAAGTSTASGRFLVAIAALLLVTLGVGFGAGAIGGRGTAGIESRVAGGVLGGLNALLLLSFGLAFLKRFLNGGRTNETVEAGWFADALVEHQGWLLGVAALVAAGLVATHRAMVRFNDELPEPIRSPATEPAVPRRRLAVAPPVDPEGGKIEPESTSPGWAALDAEVQRRDLPLSTRPVVPSSLIQPDRYDDRAAYTGTANGDGPPARGAGQRGAVNGGRSVVDEWLRRAAQPDAPAVSADEERSDRASASRRQAVVLTDAAFRDLLDPPAGSRRAPQPKVDPLAGLLPPVEPDRSGPDAPVGKDAGDGSALDPIRRCPNCLTPAGSGLVSCPFCGNAL